MSTFIAAGVEHLEVDFEICLLLDPDCSIKSNAKVDLGENPSSELNFAYHLLSITPEFFSNLLYKKKSIRDYPIFELCLIIWTLQFAIFHPPKS